MATIDQPAGHPPLHPEMREAMAVEARLRGPSPAFDDIAGQRAQGAAQAPYWSEGAPEVASVTDLAVPGAVGPLAARLYRPRTDGALPVIFLIHGGGFIGGGLALNDPMARGLAVASGAAVLATTYRLAPENPYPAAVEDCDAALAWVVAHADALGLDGSALALSGVSAGANLAVAACRHSKAPIRAAALFYGVYGTDPDTASSIEYGTGRYGLSRDRIRQFLDLYLPPGVDRQDPSVAPLLADLSQFPPTWLLAADLDPLSDDSHAFAARLAQFGIEHQFEIASGYTHGFINRGRIVAKANEMIESAGRFLRERLSG